MYDPICEILPTSATRGSFVLMDLGSKRAINCLWPTKSEKTPSKATSVGLYCYIYLHHELYETPCKANFLSSEIISR